MSRFTEGELKVMRILWQHGELKPADIQAKHADDIKNPALRSYLTILLEKGHVTRRLANGDRWRKRPFHRWPTGWKKDAGTTLMRSPRL